MAPLEPAEQREISTRILQQLAGTPYACSSLTSLASGTTNFVYRGVLVRPLPSHNGSVAAPVETVIVKHSTDFAAINKDFPLDVTRCLFEEFMLHSLINFSPSAKTVVKAPRLYLFNRETNTQVLEDFYDVVDLKSILVLPTVSDIMTESVATSIGNNLGAWLRSFHAWASEPAQAALRSEIGHNEPMRKLKYLITYNGFIEILGKYPHLVEGHEQTLQEIQDMAKREFETPSTEGEENWGIIHGDFWSGNVLVPSPPWQEAPAKLFVVDWEFAQFGHLAYDIGQMISDLYERRHFNDFDTAVSAIQGFVDGYGLLNDDMAFKVAMHAGVHLISWYNRRDRSAPLPAPEDVVIRALKLGRDFMLKGWEKDKAWFESSVLAPLFEQNLQPFGSKIEVA